MYRFLASTVFFGAVMLASAEARAGLSYETLSSSDGTLILLVSGEFEHNEPINAFLAEVRRKRPDIVTFDSPGGNVVAAMELGRLIRAQRLQTVQLRGTACSSACALAFFGGVYRFAEAGSIGVHKSSFGADATMDKDTAVSAIQTLTAEIVDYLVEMGISPRLLSTALRYEDWDMRYLSQGEMIDLGIINREDDAKARTVEAPKPVSPAPSPRLTHAQAAQFVEMMIHAHTLPPYQALPRLREFYGATIDYYGKAQSLGQVMEDKRNYFQRWPSRRYQLLLDTVAVDCAGGRVCRVTGVYNWSVRSEPRKRKAAGTASFEYALTSHAPYLVLKETSKVLQRF